MRAVTIHNRLYTFHVTIKCISVHCITSIAIGIAIESLRLKIPLVNSLTQFVYPKYRLNTVYWSSHYCTLSTHSTTAGTKSCATVPWVYYVDKCNIALETNFRSILRISIPLIQTKKLWDYTISDQHRNWNWTETVIFAHTHLHTDNHDYICLCFLWTALFILRFSG